MLKRYHDEPVPEQSVTARPVCSFSSEKEGSVQESDIDDCDDHLDNTGVTLNNSLVLKDLSSKLQHLAESECMELEKLIFENIALFPDVPSRTTVLCHDVDVGAAQEVKQQAYRVNPQKRNYLQKEIEYMLANDIIEPSKSAWSSPCLLVPKHDKSFRFCTDFQKVNALTKADSFPLPRIEDCINCVGQSCYVSKFDLLKGYWQVPLTERAKEVSAFITPDGFFQYKVMPFGMRNAPATFQRLINHVIQGLKGCEAYIDDVIVYSDSWKEHIEQISTFFKRVQELLLI